MKALFDDIKAFILDEGNKAYKAYKLPAVDAGAFVFGMIDPVRNTCPATFAVMPNSLDADGTTLGGWTEKRAVTVAVACRGRPYSELMTQMCGYAEVTRRLFMDNPGMGGRCATSEVGETRFYPDCGAAPQSITGAEIDLTVISREAHSSPLNDIFG